MRKLGILALVLALVMTLAAGCRGTPSEESGSAGEKGREGAKTGEAAQGSSEAYGPQAGGAQGTLSGDKTSRETGGSSEESQPAQSEPEETGATASGGSQSPSDGKTGEPDGSNGTQPTQTSATEDEGLELPTQPLD